MTFLGASPAVGTQTIAEDFGRIRENMRAIMRGEFPHTAKATAATVSIAATDYMIRFTGSTNVSQINITAATTSPDVIHLWAYAEEGFRFLGGGNIDGIGIASGSLASGAAIQVRPYIPFQIVAFAALGKVRIFIPQEGFENFNDCWMRHSFIQAAPGPALVNGGFSAAPTVTGANAYFTYGDRMGVQLSAAGAAAVSGVYSSFTEFDLGHHFKASFSLLLPRTTLVRFWFGFFSALPDATDSPTGRCCAIRYSTIAGDTTWKLVTKTNAGSVVVTDLGQTHWSKYYDVEISMNRPGETLSVQVDGVQKYAGTAPSWVYGTDTVGIAARCTNNNHANGADLYYNRMAMDAL